MAEATEGRLAIVTGASSGIGHELARMCAAHGMVVLACADEPEIVAASASIDGDVTPIEADLSTAEGVAALWAAAGDRPVDYLLANAGITLGGAFVDQDVAAFRRVIDTNITGTTLLLHHGARAMAARGSGRILVTGSIVGRMPGPFQAIYNGSKAYLGSLAYALRNELADSNVTVTCLMPGATDTEAFARGGMEETVVGKAPKAGPEMVARTGYEAMMRGDAGIVPGFLNKVATAFAGIIPEQVLAEMHRVAAKPR